jgi:hypothetical protein
MDVQVVRSKVTSKLVLNPHGSVAEFGLLDDGLDWLTNDPQLVMPGGNVMRFDADAVSALRARLSDEIQGTDDSERPFEVEELSADDAMLAGAGLVKATRQLTAVAEVREAAGDRAMKAAEALIANAAAQELLQHAALLHVAQN